MKIRFSYFCSIKDCRYGFQGQERDEETGWDNYKYRMHDPRLGRFFAIDPLAPDYPWNSPYAFSENDVIRAIELEGLEKFIVTSRTFYPLRRFNETTGMNFIGDNRGFSLKPFKTMFDPSTDKVTSRVEAQMSFDTQDPNYTMLNVYSSGSPAKKDPLNPEKMGMSETTGKITSNENKSDGCVNRCFEYSGSNPHVPGAAEIDAQVHLTVNVNSEKSLLTLRASVTGDNFPAHETFITDSKGNSVFLAISQRNGLPAMSLLGKNTHPMGEAYIGINLDADGNFESILYNHKTYSIDEWNQWYLDQPQFNGNWHSSDMKGTGNNDKHELGGEH